MVTCVNYLVIEISPTVLDVAKDFTALMIIAEFDDIFSNMSNKDDKAREICTNDGGTYDLLFRIETTTSIDALGERNMKLESDPVFDYINYNRRLKKCKSKLFEKGNENLKQDASKNELELLEHPTMIRINFSDRKPVN